MRSNLFPMGTQPSFGSYYVKSQKGKSRKSTLVYSTEPAAERRCPGCLRVVALCVCATKHTTLAKSGDGIVRLHRETQGRKGRGVTLVKGLDIETDDLGKIAKKLKSGCGAGGTIKGDVIELQTADREKVQQLLEAMGYVVKIAGG